MAVLFLDFGFLYQNFILSYLSLSGIKIYIRLHISLHHPTSPVRIRYHQFFLVSTFHFPLSITSYTILLSYIHYHHYCHIFLGKIQYSALSFEVKSYLCRCLLLLQSSTYFTYSAMQYHYSGGMCLLTCRCSRQIRKVDWLDSERHREDGTCSH
jgi:hypothetical protein